MTLRHLAVDRTENPVVDLQAKLLEEICDILLLCGEFSRPTAFFHQMLQKFGPKIQDILLLASAFRKVTKEDVVSTDFQLLCPRYEDVFNPEIMEDAERRRDKGQEESTAEQAVLCTTGLGLRSVERGIKGDGSVGEVHEVVVLKPKVVLVSLVEELTRERGSSRAGKA